MIKPIVSIIVPIYNSDQYLYECIESIINQTYKKLDILLINDGSTDSSLSICKSFKNKDKRITLIDQKNSGVSSARNRGIMNAKGDWIMFVDADDYLNKDSIELALNNIKDDDYYYFFSSRINERKTIVLDNINKKEKLIKEILMWNKYNYDEFNSRVLNHIYNRKMIINNNVLFNNEICNGEDMLFNIEYFLCASKMIIINSSIYNYRVNSNSLTHSVNKKIVEKDELFHKYLFKLLDKYNMYDLKEIAKIRSPLGGIITCCYSYYFHKNNKNDSSEIELLINKKLYHDALEKMSTCKEYLSNYQYFLLFLIKNKKYNLLRLIFRKK